MRRAVNAVIARHEVLRSNFRSVDGRKAGDGARGRRCALEGREPLGVSGGSTFGYSGRFSRGRRRPAVRRSRQGARARVARWRDAQLLATASGGRLAITYHPDRLTVVTGGTPIEVALTPVHEWVGGAGLALQLPLAGRWTWAVETERRMFALDTAQQTGPDVFTGMNRYGRHTLAACDA